MKNISLPLNTIIICTVILISCEKGDSSSVKNEKTDFYASYFGEPGTKATKTFTAANKVTIFGYEAGAILTSAVPVAGTPVEATCGSSGILTPSSPVFLPKGTYDFYSVSINNTNSPNLTFSSGVSGQLSNGVDYLWAKCTGIAQGGTVSFVYYHKAVGIEINVAAGTGVSNLAVTSISITPANPSTSSKMQLSDGNIGVSNSIGDQTPMSLDGLKGTYIMLPLSSIGINFRVNCECDYRGTSVSSKKYTASIPLKPIFRLLLHN